MVEEPESKTTIMEDKGLRFNTGKTRHDLVPAFAQEQYAMVLTKGSEKYAERNWELGMKWSKVIASMKRHIQAFESGEDYDKETGLLHTAHIMCNAGFLTEYYKIYPQGDDRPHKYLKTPKIGLDIDEVLADWVGHWTKYHGQEVPEAWNFDRNIGEKFDKLKDDKEFWLSIPVKTNPSDIHFEPHCYITSRSIPKKWTEEWLDKNGFPTMPVHSVGLGESKIEVAKKSGIDIFVDDRYENFVELNNAGICTYLFDAPHNRRYNVGYKRIFSLNELFA
jgi:5'(3')-deoxyribonucleotidase